MSDDWNVQASYKFGPNGQNMLNVRAASEMALAGECSALAERLSEDNFLADLGDVLAGPSVAQATTTITNAFPNATQVAAPACAHGPMKDLASKGYKNRWYCSGPFNLPREQKCPPQG